MNTKTIRDTVNSQSPERRNTKYRQVNYPSEVYGARLKLDEARILDDYAKKHDLDRANVTRLALRQFALRQQMLVRVEETDNALQEPTTCEQIEQVKARLDKLSENLDSLVSTLTDNNINNLSSRLLGDFNNEKEEMFNDEFVTYIERAFKEQRQILERILATVTLAFRIYVNYSVEPLLRPLSYRESELAAHLEAADKGRENWSIATSKIITHTRRRVLSDFNLLPEEKAESSHGG